MTIERIAEKAYANTNICFFQKKSKIPCLQLTSTENIRANHSDMNVDCVVLCVNPHTFPT